jgi:hypothetical protein
MRGKQPGIGVKRERDGELEPEDHEALEPISAKRPKQEIPLIVAVQHRVMPVVLSPNVQECYRVAGCANSGLLRFDVHHCGHRGDHVIWTLDGENEVQLADFCGKNKAFPGVPVNRSRRGATFRTWPECKADITLQPWSESDFSLQQLKAYAVVLSSKNEAGLPIFIQDRHHHEDDRANPGDCQGRENVILNIS